MIWTSNGVTDTAIWIFKKKRKVIIYIFYEKSILQKKLRDKINT